MIGRKFLKQFFGVLLFLATAVGFGAQASDNVSDPNGFLNKYHSEITQLADQINQQGNIAFRIIAGNGLSWNFADYQLPDNAIILAIDNNEHKAGFIFGPFYYRYGHADAGRIAANIMRDNFRPELIKTTNSADAVPLAVLSAGKVLLSASEALSRSSSYVTGWLLCILLGFAIFLLIEYRSKTKLYLAALLGGILLVLIGFLTLPYLLNYRYELPDAAEHITVIPVLTPQADAAESNGNI